MKFSCEKALLQNAITVAIRATAAKSPIPALEGLLLEATSALQISGYDLKTGIRAHVPAEVAKAGSVVLNARLFAEIVRRLPDDFVTVTVDENCSALITCGMSEFHIVGSSAEDYPELPQVDRENSITLPQGTLKSMIAQTIFAVSDNEVRPVHTGSLFDIENKVLTMVSVDGYRLALRREKLEETELENGSFIVPGAALSEVEKICEDSEEPVVITVGGKHIMFSIGDTVVISRRLEGDFLNYKQAIPKESKYVIRADRRSLIASVERVSLLINDRLKSPIRCLFGDGQVNFLTTTALGRASDFCKTEGNGEGLEIGFNNKYLLDALKAAGVDALSLQMNNGISPCVLVPADGGDSFAYMILPVRLRANES